MAHLSAVLPFEAEKIKVCERLILGATTSSISLFHVPGIECERIDTANFENERESVEHAFFALVYVNGFK